MAAHPATAVMPGPHMPTEPAWQFSVAEDGGAMTIDKSVLFDDVDFSVFMPSGQSLTDLLQDEENATTQNVC